MSDKISRKPATTAARRSEPGSEEGTQSDGVADWVNGMDDPPNAATKEKRKSKNYLLGKGNCALPVPNSDIPHQPVVVPTVIHSHGIRTPPFFQQLVSRLAPANAYHKETCPGSPSQARGKAPPSRWISSIYGEIAEKKAQGERLGSKLGSTLMRTALGAERYHYVEYALPQGWLQVLRCRCCTGVYATILGTNIHKVVVSVHPSYKDCT